MKDQHDAEDSGWLKTMPYTIGTLHIDWTVDPPKVEGNPNGKTRSRRRN